MKRYGLCFSIGFMGSLCAMDSERTIVFKNLTPHHATVLFHAIQKGRGSGPSSMNKAIKPNAEAVITVDTEFGVHVQYAIQPDDLTHAARINIIPATIDATQK